MTKPWYRRPGRMIPLALLAAGLVAGIAWVSSPWPAALLIRALFEQDAQKTVSEMTPYVPTSGVEAMRGVAYADGGTDTTFDLFRPSDATGPLPVVVWIHGGAWISGQKENVDPYAEIIAASGFVTVALNYTVSPEATYPTALNQVNTALGYLVDHASELGFDPDRVVLAGDSAGSNLASQMAVLTTSPDYADVVGVEPALTADQLTALVLNCGIYDVSGIPDAPGLGGWGFRIALWAYIGSKDWSQRPGGEQMSTLDFVTADFPTTWISGGNGDPLTATQSEPLATKLDGLGVDVTTVFYPSSHEPSLPHEYQFHLDLADAQTALRSTIEFLNSVTADEE